MNDATLHQLNQLPRAEAVAQLKKCCAATWWCEQMADNRPHPRSDAMHHAADQHFDRMTDAHWLEAFAAHPRIGDLESLRMKYAGNRQWSRGEQAGVDAADDAVLERLAAGNEAYFHRFGFIFIICATGKSAAEMLAALESRLPNDRPTELRLAAVEQRKISHLRLDKLEIPTS